MGYALAFAAVVAPLALWGIVDAILRHREKMAQLKRDAEVENLTQQKGELTDQVGLLEDRIAVLERIATDPAKRTADEIEKLR